MRISKYFNTLIPSTTDIKQDARNLLLIGQWFTDSTLAKDLKLTQALEWIAQSCGFKSYAAFKASGVPNDGKLPVKYNLTTLIEHDHPADALFLQTVFNYLITPSSSYRNKFPIYAEPTALLVYAIRSHEAEYSSDLFVSLAAINAIGAQLYRDYEGMGQNEVTILDSSPANGLAKKILRYTEITNASGDTYEIDWEVKKDGKWVDLTIENLNTPIKLPHPELNKGKIAKLINAKTILNIELISNVLDEIGRFTSNQNIYDYSAASYYDQPLEDGIKITYQFDSQSNKLNKSLKLGDVDIYEQIFLEISYIDQNNAEQTLQLDWIGTSYSLYRAENNFAFDEQHGEHRYFPLGDIAVGSIEQKLADVVRAEVIKTLVKYPYVLGNIWCAAGGLMITPSPAELSKEREKRILEHIESQIDEELEATHRYVIENPEQYMDEATYQDVFGTALQLDPLVDTDTYNLIWGKAYSDPRFSKVLDETVENKRQEMKAQLMSQHDFSE